MQQDPNAHLFKVIFLLDGEKLTPDPSLVQPADMLQKIETIRSWLVKKIDFNPSFICFGPGVHQVRSLHKLQERLNKIEENKQHLPM